MTLREIKYHADAYWWRKDELGEMLAHFTSIIANPYYKQKLTANKIYKRGNSNEPSKTKEELQKEFEKAVKLMGTEAIPVTRQVN